MKSNSKYLLLLSIILLATISCKDDKQSDLSPVLFSNEMELTLMPGEWVYYRFSDSTIVGTGIIGDSIDDAEWFNRLDWDIAFSEGGIRTNSGASGKGQGGLTYLNDSLFNLDSYEHISSLYYNSDEKNISITIPLDR